VGADSGHAAQSQVDRRLDRGTGHQLPQFREGVGRAPRRAAAHPSRTTSCAKAAGGAKQAERGTRASGRRDGGREAGDRQDVFDTTRRQAIESVTL